MKQIATCTSTPQQWHKPKASKGGNVEKCSVDDLGKVSTSSIMPSDEVTNFFLDAFSKGTFCDYVNISRLMGQNVVLYFLIYEEDS